MAKSWESTLFMSVCGHQEDQAAVHVQHLLDLACLVMVRSVSLSYAFSFSNTKQILTKMSSWMWAKDYNIRVYTCALCLSWADLNKEQASFCIELLDFIH